MKRLIIGLGYRARSGKDTAGEHLVKYHGFKRIAFADRLKETVGAMLGVDAFDPEFKETLTPLGLTGGQVLQRVGVGLKSTLSENLWIQLADLEARSVVDPRIVITDCRFLSEAAAIKRLGGYLVEIQRPGVGLDRHISESEGAKIPWDFCLRNDGPVDQLYAYLNALIAYLNGTDDGAPNKPQDFRAPASP